MKAVLFKKVEQLYGCWLTHIKWLSIKSSLLNKAQFLMHRSLLLITLLCFSLFVRATAEETAMVGNPLAGKAKSESCTACHGPDGNSPTPIWPKIAGLSEAYLMQQLMNFQQGEKGPRYNESMYGMVQNLSQQDLMDLSAYYSSQVMSIGEAQQDKVALGQAIYRGGNILTGVPACAACHGAIGEGNALAKFPRLAGQNSEYIVDQLKKFKYNQRSNDPNEMMRNIASRLTDQEIEAVASYVAGLH